MCNTAKKAKLRRLCAKLIAILESPPPPYCRSVMEDKFKPEDRAPSERSDLLPGSLSTDGQGARSAATWCQLAYWEMAVRVGKMYAVEQPAVNVFSASPDDRGLCLDALATGRTAPDNVARTRAKIGLGVTLSRETDGIWVYNRSEQPIFVHSPTLDDAETRTLLVYRVPAGHCLCIFDSAKAADPLSLARNYYNAAPTGPIDFNSVRISFAKGWGPKYSRQDVTACPCWLEVLLVPHR